MKLNKYQVRYTDSGDEGCPDFTCVIHAYNKEHAMDKFFDSDDDDWKVLSIKKVKGEK